MITNTAVNNLKREPIQLRIPIISDKQSCCAYKKPFGYIYLVRNLVNDHLYIGQHKWCGTTLDPKYKGSGKRLRCAYKKYGISNFEMTILEWVNTNLVDLNRAEMYWIDVFGTFRFPQHYNETLGGDGLAGKLGVDSPNYGLKRSDKVRQQQSIRVKEQWANGVYKSIKGQNNPTKRKEVRDKIAIATKEYYIKHPELKDIKLKRLKELWNTNRDLFPQCKIGKDNPAYGRGKPVICIDTNQRFDNSYRASEWVRDTYPDKYPLASGEKIARCCRGSSKSAYKHHWRYY